MISYDSLVTNIGTKKLVTLEEFETQYDLVYIDSETTGISVTDTEIIEISAIEFNAGGGIGREFYTLCCPVNGYIPSDASAINGITNMMVRGKPNYLSDGIREMLDQFINGRRHGGHNYIGFDMEMLRLDPNGIEVFDTMLMAREIFGNQRRVNLASTCSKLKIKFDKKEAHRATYDVLKGIECYVAMNGMNNARNDDLFGIQTETVCTVPFKMEDDLY